MRGKHRYAIRLLCGCNVCERRCVFCVYCKQHEPLTFVVIDEVAKFGEAEWQWLLARMEKK